MEVIRIARKDLRALFTDPKTFQGNTIISMDTKTVAKLSGGKKNPMQGLVSKITTGSVSQVFQNRKASSYEAQAKRNMAKEGLNPDDFTVQKRTWGERVQGTPVIEHTSKTTGEYNEYLETLGIKSGKVSFEYQGKPINEEDIEGYKRNSYGTQGGQEKKVIINNFKFSSILAFRMNGKSYIVED